MEIAIEIRKKTFLAESYPATDNIDQKESYRKFLALAIPNTFTCLLQRIADITTLFYIGLIEDPKYSGIVGLGLTWFNITAYSIVFGLTGAIDSFVSQSFGKKDFEECGRHFYRGFIISLIACIPLVFVLYYADFFLNNLGVPMETALLTGTYSCYLIPNLFFSFMFELLKKFLNAQKIASPTTMVIIATTILHQLWCYLFIFVFSDESYLGAATAKNITSCLNFLFLASYVLYTGKCKDTLGSFNLKEVSKKILPYLKLSITNALGVALDWWAFEIMNIMAAYLGEIELSANAALLNLNSLSFMIAVGIGSAANTFVGNNIGAKNIQGVKKYIKISLITSTITILCFSFLLFMFRYYVGLFFFHDEEILDLFASVYVIQLFSGIFDIYQWVFNRILIGMKKQCAAVWAIFVAYYGILIPSGYLFVFNMDMSLHGIWYAFSLSTIVLVILNSITVANVNLEQLCKQIHTIK